MKTLISRITFIVLMQAFASTLFAHVGLDYPQGGETFTVGETVTIQWHIEIPHNTLNWDVLISFDGGSTWEFIQMDLPVNELSYQWVVPDHITSQARVSVIQDNSGTDYQDESMNFTIAPPPMLPVIVSGAMNIVIESNVETQYDAIQAWLDNHGGATVNSFCNDLTWTDDYIGLNNTCGSSGNAEVTFTATDECGSTETVATVTVVDTSPPVLEQPASPSVVECDGNGNMPEFNAWLGNQGGAIASDAGASFSWIATISGIESGCNGTSITSIIFTAIDECDNSTTTSATFTIEDHTPPAIQTTAQDTTIECGLPNTQTVLQNWLERQGGAKANDVCGNIFWTNNFPLFPDTCNGTITSWTVEFTASDDCGNTNATSTTITFLDVLSGTSGSIPLKPDFSVSPNPVSDVLKIECTSRESHLVHLTLIDACGKSVLSYREMSGEIYIPVHGYAPGLYILQVETRHGVSVQKVIID